MIFGFSRWQFIHFLLHADARSVSRCHVMAFEEAGGIPAEILYDRMKQVVVESFREGVVFHPVFEAMVAHYGYAAIPLAPGYKEGKGKVEEPFRFVEENFLPGQHFCDFEDLNRQARQWRDSKALREHRTTHEQPAARLAQERQSLRPLPERSFDAALVQPRQVGDDYCVSWETNRYSVRPCHVGKEAWCRALMGELVIHIDGEEADAHHQLRDTRHKRYVLPEHEAEFRAHSLSRHVLADQFARLGSGAEDFAEGLRQQKGVAAGYHMSRILQLADKVGVLRVAEALRHAARYGAFDAHAVARIVTGKRLPDGPILWGRRQREAELFGSTRGSTSPQAFPGPRNNRHRPAEPPGNTGRQAFAPAPGHPPPPRFPPHCSAGQPTEQTDPSGQPHPARRAHWLRGIRLSRPRGHSHRRTGGRFERRSQEQTRRATRLHPNRPASGIALSRADCGS